MILLHQPVVLRASVRQLQKLVQYWQVKISIPRPRSKKNVNPESEKKVDYD